MIKTFLLSIFLTLFLISPAQNGYDLKFNLKGSKDTCMYLAKYFFDQTIIVDTTKCIKKEFFQFKGKMELDKGVYILVNQDKARYIDFIINDNQKFSVSGDMSNLIETLKCINSKENDELFSYAKFMTNKDKDYRKFLEDSKTKNKKDSVLFMSQKQIEINDAIKSFDLSFSTRNKGTFIWDFMNLRTEKYPLNVPNASNGRPDSIYQYYYYKNHFFEGVNFKDDRVIYTPFFADRIKKYFDQVIIQHPDTVIKSLDNILLNCNTESIIFKTLIGHFTYKFETNKSMSFDQFGNCNTFEKVFVYLADNYITNGKAKGIYDNETISKIKERVNILRNLLPGYKVADLQMIDTIYGKQVLKMGFDTAKTSVGATYLYTKNYAKLTPMFKTLYEIKAKYTILIFWAEDCGHCQKEVPKLHEDLKELIGKVDFKVLAVQTKEELFDEWKKFIVEKKLTNFIHVFDPIHLNNIKETFDISGTPVIYLLDKDKKIKAKKLGAEQVTEIIKNLEIAEKKYK